jgi:hypothetical protein
MTMRLSNYLFEIAEERKKFCNELTFPDDDVRRDFHGIIYSVLNLYYYGLVSFELSESISNSKVIFTEDMHQNKAHIDRLVEITRLPMISSSVLSSLNLHAITGAWTAFELCITTIADVVLDENEKNALLSIKKDEVLKILKHQAIPPDIIERLSKKLTDNNLAHVPFWRKFTKILDKYKTLYSRDSTEDMAYIKFFGTLRNTLLHSNSIYFGKDFEYVFKGYRFLFENGKLITYNQDNELWPRLYVELILHLSQIFTTVAECLHSVKEIKYPDTEIHWEE